MAYSGQDSGVLRNTGLAGVDWGLVLVVMVSAGTCRGKRQIQVSRLRDQNSQKFGQLLANSYRSKGIY